MDIIKLPYDILVMIGCYLDRRELHYISLSCSLLHKLGSDDVIWRNMYMYDYGGIAISEKEKNNVAEDTWKGKYVKKYTARANDVVAFNANPTVIPGLAELHTTQQYNIERYSIQFLQYPNVSRVARGIYLSLTDARTSGLLGSYFDTFDFTNETVLEGLTKLLNYVQFPSHFSVITKFMLYFAERYFACNRNSIFKNSDAVYVLAFGIIMLNTDMHNSAVKNKMTLAQYIQNSSGINQGENLPVELLADIYAKVKEKPLVFNKFTPNSNQYDSSLWSWVSDWIAKLKK